MALKKIFRPRNIIIALIALGIAGYAGAQYFGFGEKEEKYNTTKAYRGNLIQTVDVTGTVKAMAEIDLNFETTGKLASTTVEVGDYVAKGDLLAELDNMSLQYDLDKAKAALDLAQANLDLKLAGETNQAINVSAADVAKAEAALRSAEVSLAQAEKDLENAKVTTGDDLESAMLAVEAAYNTLNIRQTEYDNALAKADSNVDDAYEDAVVTLKNSLTAMTTAISDMDNILGVDDTAANSDFKKYLSVLDQGALERAKDYYLLAKDAKAEAHDAINPLKTTSDNSDIRQAISVADDALNEVHTALTETRLVLDNTITGTGLTLTELNSKKSTIDTDLSTINTRLTSLLTDKQTIQNLETSNTTTIKAAELALTSAQDSYEQALQNLEASGNTTESSLDKYESAVETAQASYDVQKASYDAARAAYDLKVADPRLVDLAPLQAQVDSAEAAYNMALERLDDSRIYAPASGIITKVNYEVGEQVSATSASLSSGLATSGSGGMMTLLATDLFDVEVDIPETDIVKVKVGDPAEITLDAFGEDTIFSGTVTHIDPAETVIQDVVYYQVKVKIEFTAEQAVKNGMTANVIIKTDERANAVIIPQRSIIIQDDKEVVRVLKDGNLEYRQPSIGLRGDEGKTEIISGVAEGEEVVTSIIED